MDKLKQYRQNNGELYAWLCLDEYELNLPVPKEFPNSENKTWSNYSTITVTPDNYIFILVGEHDIYGNRKEVISDDEFELWVTHFSGRNFWNYEDARSYMNQFESNIESIDGGS